MNDPYLSVVVTSRNDNYGGRLIPRMEVFLNGLFGLAARNLLELELILVEWNPPLDRQRLVDTVQWPSMHGVSTIRIIEVPHEIHDPLPNSDRIPIFEFIAKNVGVRRANGQFILVTNPDSLYSAALVKLLATRTLSKECFYRVDRFDVVPPIPEGSLDEQLDYCRHNVSRLHGRGQTFEVGEFSAGLEIAKLRWIINRLRKITLLPRKGRIEDRYHTNASGDFLLMARSSWLNLRGYPEFFATGHIDSYLVIMAASAGFRQVILPGSNRLYHEGHERSVDYSDLKSSTRPLVAYDEWLTAANCMLSKMEPLAFNKENWGLRDHDLREHEVLA